MSVHRRCTGFTLPELILAIVVIGIGVAGLVIAFSTAVRNSADPVIDKQLMAIAEAMMEEIALKPLNDPGTGGTIPAVGCVRSAADDVGDYAAYVDRAICDLDGNAVPVLAAYRVSVLLTPGDLLGGVPMTRITVTAANGNNQFVLVGWRWGG